jgi:YfiH family protein
MIEPLRSPIFDRVPHIEHGFFDATAQAPTPMGRAHQVHGVEILEYKGDEPLSPLQWPKADTVITGVKDLWVGVQTADCIPLLFAALSQPYVMAVHAGWKGVLLGAAVKAIEYAEKNKGIRPRDWVVAMGPSIGPCCFEVGTDLIADFESQWGWMWAGRIKERPWQKGRDGVVDTESLNAPIGGAARTTGSDHWLNLKAVTKMQLVNAGVLEPSIDPIPLCTYCGVLRLHGETFKAETNDWASHRRGTHEGFKAGRQWSAIRTMSKEMEMTKRV